MIKFNNGEYSGEEFNGLPNGYGEFVFNNGDRYVGHFYDGKIDGSGTLTRSNGNVISGEFTNGEIIKGSCKYASGIFFEG